MTCVFCMVRVVNSYPGYNHHFQAGTAAMVLSPMVSRLLVGKQVLRLLKTHTSPHQLWLTTSRTFQTSSERKAGFFMTPLARGLAAILARVARSRWNKMSPEKRQVWKAALAARKNYLLGGGALLTGGGVLWYFHHIEQAPITGRRRFMMFSRSQLVDMIAEEKEDMLKMLAGDNTILPSTSPVYEKIHSIITQILAKNWSPDFDGIQWKLYVLDSPETVNAVCLPSGEIFVFSGIVEACHNQDELAFILAHEISHAVLGHGIEVLSNRGLVEFFMLFVVGAIWAVIPNDLASFFLHKWSMSTAEVLLHLPYSRKLETEADEVGLIFAANACFNPERAAKVWKHLNMFNVDDKVLEYLSTHPSNETRYETLLGRMSHANSIWVDNSCEEMKEEADSFQVAIGKALKKVFKFW